MHRLRWVLLFIVIATVKSGVFAQDFDVEFAPLRCGDEVAFDQGGDASPSRVDLIGDETSPASSYGLDDEFVYFQIRISGDPRGRGGQGMFRQSYWAMGIDLDGQRQNGPEAVALVDGPREEVRLADVDGTTLDVCPGPCVWSTSSHSRRGLACEGGGCVSDADGNGQADYLITWAIPQLAFESIGARNPLTLWAGADNEIPGIGRDNACVRGANLRCADVTSCFVDTVISPTCSSDAACGAGSVLGVPVPLCRAGRCVECEGGSCSEPECEDVTCVLGFCENTPAAAGIECSDGVCDGLGACVDACVDDAMGGEIDTGCEASAPACDTSTDSPVCRSCAVDADCLAGVCEGGECLLCRSAPELVDEGCPSVRPVCDESSDACVECLVDADCAGGVCSSARRCLGCELDTDCATGVCAEGRCEGCRDDGLGTVDQGCEPSAPVCGSSGCEACEDTGVGVDFGCSDARPVCVTSSGAAQCVSCLASPEAIDLGCSAEAPLCLGEGQAAGCIACQPSATDIDRGCSAAEPVCGEAGCVECASDEDCPGADCDTARNQCGGCSDTVAGPDPECGGTRPYCDAESRRCAVCEVDEGLSVDSGCSASAPRCLESGGVARCVECERSSECEVGVCNEATGRCSDCINDSETGRDTGCEDEAPSCDAPTGELGRCRACTPSEQAVDTGCTLALPACDTSSGSGCARCLDDAPAGFRDSGCPIDLPACAAESRESRRCVQCIDDADCVTGVCSDSRCVACRVEPSAATDKGCGPAAPVCEVNADRVACVACDPALGRGCNELRPVCADTVFGPRCQVCDDDSREGVDMGCNTDAPVCATSGDRRVCVRCDVDLGSDLACGPGSPVCDARRPFAAECVECLRDAECEPGLRCAPDGVCALPCDDNSACAGARAICDDASRTCVTCVESSDCGPDQVCDPLRRDCAQCVVDNDCEADAPACDARTGSCVQCQRDRDCGEGVCDTVRQVCVGCVDSTQCPSSRPVCEVSSKTCVQCGVPSDCSSERPLCREDGSCAQCERDSDCLSGACDESRGTCTGRECEADVDCVLAYSDAPLCDRGRCVECESSAECETGACEQGRCADCGDDSECPYRCVDGACGECESDSDCRTGQTCDRTWGQCVVPCANAAACAGFAAIPHCDSDRGVCAECVTDAHCPSGDVCAARGECVGCNEDTDCGAGVCEGEQCVGCRRDGDCGALGRCDPWLRECYRACDDDGGCVGLSQNRCAETGTCVECLDSSDCVQGERCDRDLQVCRPRCDSDDDCESDRPLCDQTTGRCRECFESTDCERAVCDVTGTCVGCVTSRDCFDDHFCDVDQRCRLECETPADCPDYEPICDPADSYCVECLGADDCVGRNGLICLPSRVCGCNMDIDCQPGFRCGRTQVCVRGQADFDNEPGTLGCCGSSVARANEGPATFALLVGTILLLVRRRR